MEITAADVQSGVFPVAKAPIPSGLQMMLCLWGIVTFAFFICALALNIALQVWPLRLLCLIQYPAEATCLSWRSLQSYAFPLAAAISGSII